MKTAIITNIFGPLEINRLALIIKEVAAGSLTPIEPYIFSNTGTHNKYIAKWGSYLEINDPALYESMTGKKAKKPVFEFSESKEEVKKIDTSHDDLYAYQKKREAEREAQLEKEREKLKKKEFKFNFTTPKKDWSIYGGWVNPFEPINKGRLGSTQEWRKEKPKRHYY